MDTNSFIPTQRARRHNRVARATPLTQLAGALARGDEGADRLRVDQPGAGEGGVPPEHASLVVERLAGEGDPDGARPEVDRVQQRHHLGEDVSVRAARDKLLARVDDLDVPQHLLLLVRGGGAQAEAKGALPHQRSGRGSLAAAAAARRERLGRLAVSARREVVDGGRDAPVALEAMEGLVLFFLRPLGVGDCLVNGLVVSHAREEVLQSNRWRGSLVVLVGRLEHVVS
mmetsp:Transcript_15202/g.51227  ORF Transcript_15202/g.51227 Transcript_15202/m.51227 type:complete len:229 (+) Transcript_15202:42-728(+)